MRINDCCNKWKTMIQDAWNRANEAVQGIKLESESTINYPDGNGIVHLDIKADVSDIEQQVVTNTNDISAMKVDIASNKASASDNATAISNEVTARQDADTSLNAALMFKQNKLTAGDGIAISSTNVISATGSGSDFTAQNNDGNITFWKDGVQEAILKEGANVTISADGTISAAGGSASAVTASEVSMDDGRTVQTAIDTLEDEIGDASTTTGTIQNRLDALETSDASQTNKIASLETDIGTKQDALNATQLSAVNSGITRDKVTTYDGYATSIAGKQDALTNSQLSVIDNTALQGGYFLDSIYYRSGNIIVTDLSVTPPFQFYISGGNYINITGTSDESGGSVFIEADLSSKADSSTVTELSSVVSKCYNDYSVDHSEGNIGITMKAADGMTNVSDTILTAGDNISISTEGVISASASGGSAPTIYAEAHDSLSDIYSIMRNDLSNGSPVIIERRNRSTSNIYLDSVGSFVFNGYRSTRSLFYGSGYIWINNIMYPIFQLSLYDNIISVLYMTSNGDWTSLDIDDASDQELNFWAMNFE